MDHRIRALEDKATNQRATLLEIQADSELLISGYFEHPEQTSDGIQMSTINSELCELGLF